MRGSNFANVYPNGNQVAADFRWKFKLQIVDTEAGLLYRFLFVSATDPHFFYIPFSIVLSSGNVVVSSVSFIFSVFKNCMRNGLQFAISILQLRLSSFSIILLHNSCYLTGAQSVVLSSLHSFCACVHCIPSSSSSPSSSLQLLDCPFPSTL